MEEGKKEVRTHRIVLFDNPNSTVSKPFEVTSKQLEKIKEFCYDTEYSFAFEDTYLMTNEEVDEIIAEAEIFWENMS